MDYSTFILTPKEQAVWKKFRKSDSAFLTRDEFQLLRNKNLVSGMLDGKSDWFDVPDSGVCTLSQRGLELKAYERMHNAERRKDSRRYALTTSIAILALIVAIVSICLQYL